MRAHILAFYSLVYDNGMVVRYLVNKMDISFRYSDVNTKALIDRFVMWLDLSKRDGSGWVGMGRDGAECSSVSRPLAGRVTMGGQIPGQSDLSPLCLHPRAGRQFVLHLGAG